MNVNKLYLIYFFSFFQICAQRDPFSFGESKVIVQSTERSIVPEPTKSEPINPEIINDKDCTQENDWTILSKDSSGTIMKHKKDGSIRRITHPK